MNSSDAQRIADLLKTRREFAEELLILGNNERHDARRYVLLSEAVNWAVQCGDVPLTMKFIEEFAMRFNVDELELIKGALSSWSDLIPRVNPDVTSKKIARAKLGEMALQHGQTAMEMRRFVSAIDFFEIAITEASSGGDTVGSKNAKAKRHLAQRASAGEIRLSKLLPSLKDRPDSEQLNFDVGHALVFEQGDWRNGLPYLAKGPKSPLTTAAQMDILGAFDVDQYVVLGDQWWDLVDPSPMEQRGELLNRTAYWYRKANDQATGLTKLKVEKRLKEIDLRVDAAIKTNNKNTEN